jgi:hypothetical protein
MIKLTNKLSWTELKCLINYVSPFYNFEAIPTQITISNSLCIIVRLFAVTDTRFSEPLSSNGLFHVYLLPQEHVLIL